MTDNQASATQDDALKQLVVQKIYLKDCSFESPNSPEMFAVGQWDPKLQLNITTSSKVIGPDLWEVVLHINIEAGIVTLKGFTEEERRRLLGGYCPGLVFPYAREAVSDLVGKGGFPQLMLQPINFEALYQRHSDETRAQQSAAGAGVEPH